MKYFFLLLFAALVFGLCFLVDKLTGRLWEKAVRSPVVRLPLRYPVAAALLTLTGVGVGIYAVMKRSVLFGVGAAVLLALAVYFLYCYRRMGIDYDGEGFTFRKGRVSQRFAFGAIDGQRVAVSRRSFCLVLCLGRDEVVIYGNMQGVRPFLDAAYQGWCRAKGLDPAAQDWHNPADFRWFPDQQVEED